MTTLTETELQAIEARANAATLGPWRWLMLGEWYLVNGPAGKETSILPGLEGFDDLVDRPDAQFIAHARQDIPALIASLRAARADMALIKHLHQRCEDHPDELWDELNAHFARTAPQSE